CRAASAASPAVRELLVRRLAEVEGPEALEERLAKLLGSHSTRLRSLAALGLRRLFPGREVKRLVVRAVLDGSDSGRLEASLALRASGEPAVILPVVRALESTNVRVRVNSAEALGNMGFEAAVPALITRLASLSNAPAPAGTGVGGRGYIFVGSQVAYVQDFDVEVAQFQAAADPQVNVLTEGSVLDVRAIGVTIESVAFESRRVRGALQRLTGANPGNSSKSWLDWWETNKGRWIPGEGPETPGH
ncbi:MAG TPA: HEAT repeat domain-containing protein, partial [Planctomycetota bacterium]|nr:HEAT repeat domain-containing protein [Planctomycetota bacterium]